jgi:hypothetical protein
VHVSPHGGSALDAAVEPTPEHLPSRAAQQRARLRACGRVRVQLSRGGGNACTQRTVRTRP